jgi:hypothetical protein
MYSFPRLTGAPDPNAAFAAIKSGELRRSFADFFREERAAGLVIQVGKSSTKHRVVASSLPELIELEDLSSLLSIP